ncbi:MAG: cell division protein FtsX [Bacteroidales bacterium]
MSKRKKKTTPSFLNVKLTSTVSISLVLFLLGMTTLLTLLTHELSIYVKENIGMSIVLSDRMPEADIKQLNSRLQRAPYTREVTYITKDQALKELVQELGEDPKEFLGFNPLLASIEVKLKAEYANNDSINKIETNLKKSSNIRDILYRKELISAVNDNVKRIGLVLIVLAALLTAISFVLISNTIRLTIYSQRFLIHTMKLVGAKDSFIRSPFIWSNIACGIIAAILANAMLAGVVHRLSLEIEDIWSMITPEIMIITAGTTLIFGILLTALSAYFAVNRYLNMKYNKLFLV